MKFPLRKEEIKSGYEDGNAKQPGKQGLERLGGNPFKPGSCPLNKKGPSLTDSPF
jgi:hypothetical protein